MREINYNSNEYLLEVELRSKVLRVPLGLNFTQEELSLEANHIHLGYFLESHLIACLILTPISEKVIKMRQVAVDPKAQRCGVGKKLVSFSESLSRQKGYHEIILNARDTAVPFYLNLGYEAAGEIFEEVGIPHQKMTKRLVNLELKSGT